MLRLAIATSSMRQCRAGSSHHGQNSNTVRHACCNCVKVQERMSRCEHKRPSLFPENNSPRPAGGVNSIDCAFAWRARARGRGIDSTFA